MSLLREVAIAHGYGDSFWVAIFHVVRSTGRGYGRGGSRKTREPVEEGEWYLQEIDLMFKENTEEVLPFLLECLPPCQALNITKPSDDDEDWIPLVCVVSSYTTPSYGD